MNKPESSVDEWRKEAERLIESYADGPHLDGYFGARRAVLLAHLAAHPSNQVLQGYALVPCIGTVVKAKHPITCLNPTEFFEVTQVRAESDGKFAVRGEQTCWFGLSYLAASPQAVPLLPEQPQSEQPKSANSNLTSASGGDDLPPATPALRSAKDYAIEHAEYMAQAGDNLRRAVHVLASAEENNEPEEAIEDAQQAVNEAMAGLAGAIYEFRKRRDRAACEASAGAVPSDKKDLPSSAAPAGQEVRMLTDEEVWSCECSTYERGARAVQRRFAEVNGLKLAAMSATTKEN